MLCFWVHRIGYKLNTKVKAAVIEIALIVNKTIVSITLYLPKNIKLVKHAEDSMNVMITGKNKFLIFFEILPAIIAPNI